MKKLSPVIQSNSPVQQSSPQSSPVMRYDPHKCQKFSSQFWCKAWSQSRIQILLEGGFGFETSWVYACVPTLAALAGEMAGICDTQLSLVRMQLGMRYQVWLKQQIVINPAVCHGKLVNQQFAACSSLPYELAIHTNQGCFLQLTKWCTRQTKQCTPAEKAQQEHCVEDKCTKVAIL